MHAAAAATSAQASGPKHATIYISHITVCWESTPRIAFLSPEPGNGKSRALEVDHETRSGRRQVPLSALAQPETKVRKI
jgi:hypothetical protein